jgi:hypothetical protein
MTGSDQSVVSNQVFWTGLHRVEVIRFAQPVDEEYWVKKLVPDRCLETYTCFDFIEDPKGLKLHHLYVNWKERGAVDYSPLWKAAVNGAQDTHSVPALGTHNSLPTVGVLWWIAPGESLSFSADVASTLHKRVYGVMPSAAWVRNLPRGAIDCTPLARTNSDARVRTVRVEVGEGDDHGFVELMVGEWVPERFVVVGVSG